MKKVLITGASGFAGGYLAEHLLHLGDYEVHGTYLTEDSRQTSPVNNKINFHQADLTQKDQVEKLIHEIKPDHVYHLAAMASVPQSFKDPVGTFHSNVDAQLNLFESLRKENLLDTRVLVVSSGEVYGYVTPEDLPVNEHTPLRPANPYSVSKITQDFLGLSYCIAYQMSIIRVRPFNHVGPRQAPVYVVADFAKQIAEIAQRPAQDEKNPAVIRVGNMEAKRDFTDVRDMVRAYVLILEKGIPGEVYNIGSGVSHKIQEIMDTLISLAHVQVRLENDPTKMRPSDVMDVTADSSKLTALTGWKPEIPFATTLKDTLDYWRKIV